MTNSSKSILDAMNPDRTAQTEQAREDQVVNHAGGFVFKLSPWDQLDRFLILGTEGGTYYASERQMTLNNASNVAKLIAQDGVKVVDRVVEISDSGRAPKNDPALFVLAMASASNDLKTRQAAFAALPKVARIGTHLFHYAAFVDGQRGWGRALRKAIGNWYLSQDADRLANQVIKYQQRDGWSHRDLLRLAHPKTDDQNLDAIFKWVVDGNDEMGDKAAFLHGQINAFEQIKRADNEADVVRLILDHNLPREAVPTQWLNSAKVWEALLDKMPMTAMVRNLATMTRSGLLTSGSMAEAKIKGMLGNQDALKKARVHPIQILSALRTYQSGRGARGQNTWTPVQGVVTSLDQAFYLTFGNVKPTGKPTLLGLDISGSMSGGEIAGVPGLNPRVASAAMALVTANVETDYEMVGFTSSGWTPSKSTRSYARSALTPVPIKPTMRLDQAEQVMERMSYQMGGTDCSLPFVYAKENKLAYDNFVVYTDNETYAGAVHPYQALKDYRQSSGRGAKSVVVGMTATQFTIADPSDAGMMDVVGFDAAAPQIMADFFRK